jgi:hypothetical protein
MKDIKLIGEGILCFLLLGVALVLVVCCESIGCRGFTTRNKPAWKHHGC